MRCCLAAVLLVLGTNATAAGGSFTHSVRWPDDAIAVPDLVETFILAECQDHAGMTDEGLDACVAGERNGYRATAMMLSDPKTGEKAAERYRACRAGLGMHGGRFHRRRAECIGKSLQYRWRFESTRRASITPADSRFGTSVETTANVGMGLSPTPRTE